MKETKEMSAWKMNGFFALFFEFVMIVFLIILGVSSFMNTHTSSVGYATITQEGVNVSAVISFIALCILILIVPIGNIIVKPNESRVLLFFGKYVGTIKDEGFWWVNPFTSKHSVSLKTCNLNSEQLKVNDLNGNPIEIGAVVVWRVIDSAKAILDVENYEQYVNIQSEIAIRTLAAQYPYDIHEEGKPSLRGNPAEVIDNLRKQVQEHLQVAGIEICEARISHLAYASEIAQAMLRRQQADAVVAARQRIVEGAVGMVKMALTKLTEEKIAIFPEDKKAALVSNLMVVLVSEKESTPMINTGA